MVRYVDKKDIPEVFQELFKEDKLDDATQMMFDMIWRKVPDVRRELVGRLIGCIIEDEEENYPGYVAHRTRVRFGTEIIRYLEEFKERREEIATVAKHLEKEFDE